MPKFYVRSGDFKIVLDRTDSDTAALDGVKSLETNPVKRLSGITIVSEHGFSKVSNDDDFVYNTLELLEDAGLLDKFKPKDWI